MKGINSLLTSLFPRLWVSTLSLTWNWIPLLVNPLSIVIVSSTVSINSSTNWVVVILAGLLSPPGWPSCPLRTVTVFEPTATLFISLEITFLSMSTDDQTSSHPPHWIGASPVFGSTANCCMACVNPASISTTLESSCLSFNQTSLFGFNSTPPIHVITANGFTFSVLVAKGWLI